MARNACGRGKWKAVALVEFKASGGYRAHIGQISRAYRERMGIVSDSRGRSDQVSANRRSNAQNWLKLTVQPEALTFRQGLLVGTCVENAGQPADD